MPRNLWALLSRPATTFPSTLSLIRVRKRNVSSRRSRTAERLKCLCRRCFGVVILMAFLRLAASGYAREAFQKHVAPGFRHHNPFFRGDGGIPNDCDGGKRRQESEQGAGDPASTRRWGSGGRSLPRETEAR